MSNSSDTFISSFSLDWVISSDIGLKNSYLYPIQGFINTNHHTDAILGFAFAEARAEASLTQYPSSFISIDDTTIAAAKAFAVGVDNAFHTVLKSEKGTHQVTGIAIAKADSTAIADAATFSSDRAFSNATAYAIAKATAIGIDNQYGMIKAGRGNDEITGIAIAQAAATAQAHAAASAHAINDNDPLAMAEANAQATARIDRVAAIGIDNHRGKLKTGNRADTVKGIAAIESTAATDAHSMADASAQSTARTDAKASASSFPATQIRAVGIENSRGSIKTGSGSDHIVGIATHDIKGIAAADAIATAFADNSLSNTTSNAEAMRTEAVGIGIHNAFGRINTGSGDDYVKGYGVDFGILGGRIRTGTGKDYIHAARIEQYDLLTGQLIFSQDQNNAIADVDIHLGADDDMVVIGGFGENVRLDGGSGFDTLYLPGDISDYTITHTGGNGNTVTLEQSNRVAMSVQNFELFNISDATYTFSQFIG